MVNAVVVFVVPNGKVYYYDHYYYYNIAKLLISYHKLT